MNNFIENKTDQTTLSTGILLAEKTYSRHRRHAWRMREKVIRVGEAPKPGHDRRIIRFARTPIHSLVSQIGRFKHRAAKTKRLLEKMEPTSIFFGILAKQYQQEATGHYLAVTEYQRRTGLNESAN